MNLLEIVNQCSYIKEQYQTYARVDLPRSIDWYTDMIGQWRQFRIFLNTPQADAPWKSYHIRGWLNRNDGQKTAEIYVAPKKEDRADTDPHKVTFCEHRFIALKEACHVLIDTEETYARSAQSLIEDLLFNGSHPLENTPEQYQSEVYAIVAALELLFPWEDRAQQKKLIDENQKSYFQIADEYKIPERWVFWVLSEKAHPTLQSTHETLKRLVVSSF